MHTRSQTRNCNRQQQAPPAVVEPFNLEEPFDNPPLVSMADNRTMAELLQAPTEGYEDAIVIPEINANFELKHGLINLVQNKQFFRHDKEDPHAHIHYFNKITSTMRFPDVPSTLGHKISKKGIEVDKAKIDVIAKLPHPTTVKGIRSFLEHAGFYRRFIKDFSKISRPLTHLLEKNTPFIFSEECI
ncbi:hypothetical protein Tco_0408228 [Tanacetum coccineum]